MTYSTLINSGRPAFPLITNFLAFAIANPAPKPITLNDVAGMVCADVARTGVAA